MYENFAQVGFILSVITVVILLMSLLVVNLLLTGRNRKLKHQSELQKIQSQQREKIAAVRTEVAEAILGDVSRDLHDEVGQLLTFSILRLEHMMSKFNGDQKTMITEVKQSVRDSLDAIRSISRGLSPDYVNQQGLVKSLEVLLDRARTRTDVKTMLKVSDDFYLSNPSHAIIVFRIVRECLTNALRHGKASRITIGMSSSQTATEIVFHDNGVGMNEQALKKTSMGIHGMQHYATLVNGQLQFNSDAQKGTEIFLSFPNNLN